jgi:hypothetical protein
MKLYPVAFPISELLKELWPAGTGALERPRWAWYAYQRRWMTLAEWLATPREPSTRKGIRDLLYEPPKFTFWAPARPT